MSELFTSIPNIFWIFAGIALLVYVSAHAKAMNPSSSSASELKAIKQRHDRIERQLDLTNE
jgi:sensor domain CHASE-containing protein